MRRTLTALLIATTATAAHAASLTVTVDGIADGKPIPAAQALCIPTADGKSGPGKNERPTIHWSGAPAGTQSFAVFMIDPDVPADFTDAGKEGKTIAENAKRQDFYHYGVIDIPSTATSLPGGKSADKPGLGRELKTDLGSYVPTPTQFGGPCPPWNDARLHHYHFRVLALSIAPATAPAPTSAKEALAALTPHVLAEGKIAGTYTLYPPLLMKK